MIGPLRLTLLTAGENQTEVTADAAVKRPEESRRPSCAPAKRPSGAGSGHSGTLRAA
jgi:hypothetical protein